MNEINLVDVPELLQSTKEGLIFSVTFIKKDGSERDMVCRLGVKAHLKGGEQGYDPAKYGLLCVFDMQKQDYRSINMNTVKRLKINGVEYIVKTS